MDHHSYVKDKMPLIGMGTWQIRKEETLHKVIDEGLKEGYRFIDTAQVYGNEAAIGRILEKVLPQHSLKREDIWITSKLGPANAGLKAARKSIEKSLKDLKVDYLDLMLIHWPGSSLKSENPKNKVLRQESWDVMCEMMNEGKLKAIGVSNFEISHLEELKKSSTVVPAVNQVEYHPHFHQDELVNYCRDNNIHFQAYSSLGSPTYREDLSKEMLIVELAQKYEVEIPVLLLGFAFCQGISVLPRTTKPEHVVSNFKVTKLAISPSDIERLLALKVEHKTCWDPRIVV
ncbi:unnamed protein product [Caenorhabditis nigoni]